MSRSCKHKSFKTNRQRKPWNRFWDELGYNEYMHEERRWNTDKPSSTIYGSSVSSNIACDCHSSCAEDTINSWIRPEKHCNAFQGRVIWFCFWDGTAVITFIWALFGVSFLKLFNCFSTQPRSALTYFKVSENKRLETEVSPPFPFFIFCVMLLCVECLFCF